MRGIVKACRRPHRRPLPVRPRNRRRLPNALRSGLSDGVPHGSRCPASPRQALLAENSNPKARGKPSLWVNIKDLWYYPRGNDWLTTEVESLA